MEGFQMNRFTHQILYLYVNYPRDQFEKQAEGDEKDEGGSTFQIPMYKVSHRSSPRTSRKEQKSW